MKLFRKSTFIIKNRKRVLFLLPSLAGVFWFVVLPFGDVMFRSVWTMATDAFCGLQNYRLVFTNEAFLLAAGNTLWFVLICLPLLIFTSLLIAALLQRNRLLGQLKSAYLFPLAVPTATVVLIWKMLFEKNGMVNSWLEHLGGTGVNWLGSNSALAVLILSYIWKNLGYTILLWLAGMMGIPESVKEAARVDGAGEGKVFFHIILPNLKPAFYTITILSFLNSFKVFREAYLVAGNYPPERIYLLQHLFNNWFTNLEIEKMAAAAVIVAVLLSGAVLFLQRIWDVTPEDEEIRRRRQRK